MDGLGVDFFSGVAKGAVSQGMTILANRGGKIDWVNIATNALGDAIGNAIAATFGVVQDARENRNEKWKQDHPEYTYATNPNGSLRVTGYANPPASAPLPGLGGAPLPNEPFSTEDNIPDPDAHRAPLIQNQERDEMGRPIVSDEARYFGGRANGVYFHETPDQISSSGTSGNYDATNPYQDLVDPTQPPAEARALPDRPTPWEQAKEIFGDSSVPLGPRLGRTAQALLMPNQYEAERTDVPYSWAGVGIGALKELGNLGLTGLELLGNAAFNAVAGLPAYLVGESLPYVPLPFRFEPQGAELRGAGLVEGAFLLSGVAGLERTAVAEGGAAGATRVAGDTIVANRTDALVEQLGLENNAQRALLRDALDASGNGQVAHHVIPLEAQSSYPDLIRKAAEGGFNFNGANNGILLDAAEHVGGHSFYNSVVLQELGRISPNLTAQETAFVLQRRADILRDAISNGTFKPWQ